VTPVAKDINIKIKAPGAKQAAADIKGTAGAERQLGADAKKAGKGIGKANEAVDGLTRGLGVNKSVFTNWKVGLAAGIAAVAAGLKESYDYVRRIHKEMRDAYREFVDLSRQAGTSQLAQIRGESEAATVKWMYKTGRKYSIAPEEARTAAFEMESGLGPDQVGGRKAFGQIQDTMFTSMRAFGTSGRTGAGLAIAAYESGQAKTPEEFKRFYAKAGLAAGKSRLSLESLGGILSTLLPLAVKAGIPADYFMAQAAAMSFRIGEPSRLRTALERMIRAAGTKGDALEQYAEKAGRKVADLSAVEVMEFQSRQIAGAMTRGGPQAGMAMAESLGLSPELAQVYGAAFDPEVQARMKGLRGQIGGAAWGGVSDRYAGVRQTPEAAAYSARLAKQQARQEASRKQALMAIVEDLSVGEVARMRGLDQDIPGVLEDMPAIPFGPSGGQEQAKRMYMLKELERVLRAIEINQSLSAETRAEAARRREEIFENRGIVSGDIPAGYQMYGNAESTVRGAFGFAQGQGVTVNSYNGGVQFIGQHADPAGQQQPTGME